MNGTTDNGPNGEGVGKWREFETKLYAKRRMPFDAPEAKPKRPVGVTAAAMLYGAAFVGCLGLAAFMHWGRGEEFASVPVVAPLAGGVWFLVRMLMTLRPMTPTE